jgi:hypothetical protein
MGVVEVVVEEEEEVAVAAVVRVCVCVCVRARNLASVLVLYTHGQVPCAAARYMWPQFGTAAFQRVFTTGTKVIVPGCSCRGVGRRNGLLHGCTHANHHSRKFSEKVLLTRSTNGVGAEEHRVHCVAPEAFVCDACDATVPEVKCVQWGSVDDLVHFIPVVPSHGE